MDAGEQLLAQVVENPSDKDAHLVYADWLDDQGDPIAELIRARYEWRQPAPEAAAAVELRLAPVAPRMKQPPRFVTGMLDCVHMTSRDYVEAQDALAPIVSRCGVDRTMLLGYVEMIPRCATLAWTATLSLWNSEIVDAELGELATSQHIARLSGLELESPRCSNDGLRALARSPHLARLRAFTLIDVARTSTADVHGVIELLDRLPISDLTLRVDSMDLPLLADAQAASKLESLTTDARFPRGAWIARSKRLTGLRRLAIHGECHDDDLHALADNPTFADLQQLKLFSTTVPSEAVLARLKARFGAGFRHHRLG
jgi:uncharacterized protein (TIGR02996 family)